MSTQVHALDLRSEIGRIARDFESVAGPLRAGRPRSLRDAGITRANLALALPFYLIEAFPFAGDLEVVRTLARANAFGAAHFLAQDRLLDGAEDATPAGCRLSDTFMARFVGDYADVLPGASPFWSSFYRYLDEYFESLRWEREVLWTPDGAAAISGERLPDTLTALGRKMSPLKATVSGIVHLSGQAGRLEAGERIVEAFHAGYQLLDDLSDLADDAAAGRWSVVLHMMALRSGVEEPPANLSADGALHLAVRTGAYGEAVRLAREQLEDASARARRLGLSLLASHLSRMSLSSARDHARRERRVSVLLAAANAAEQSARAVREPGRPPGASGGANGALSLPPAPFNIPPNLHLFAVDGTSFLVDGESGLFFEADEVATEVFAGLRDACPEAGLDAVRMNHGSGVVDAAMREIALLASPMPEALSGAEAHVACRSGIVSLALNVSGGCNLACDYCYLGSREPGRSTSMDRETALRAIELLIEESSGEGEISLVFFGGEPLLEPGLVLSAASHARERAEEVGRRLSLHLTTNGTLLTPDVARALRDLGVSVLVSIDGSERQHDHHRRFPGGEGSYREVASNIRRLPHDMSVSARVTVTPGSEPLVDTVRHLRDLGFDMVHLAAVSGEPLPTEFGRWLVAGLSELADWELEAINGGARPSVGNFARVLQVLDTGRLRSLACGAGVGYLCVAPEGTLYLCHRFVGRGGFAVGDVLSGVDGRAVERKLRQIRAGARACRGCWARSLCGGPCLHDLGATESGAPLDDSRCAVTKRTLELSMWLYASLSGDARRRIGLGRESGGGRREGR